jgi:hypothetical protein
MGEGGSTLSYTFSIISNFFLIAFSGAGGEGGAGD